MSETTKTEMEWRSLSNGSMITNNSALSLNVEKKFMKDSSTGGWVWYKNQVLPTLKVKLDMRMFAPTS